MSTGLNSRLFPGDERAEVRDPFESDFGSSVSFRLSLRIPKSAMLTTDNQSIVIAQYKATNGESPVFALRWKGGDRIVLTLRAPTGEIAAFPIAVKQGVWHSFTFHVTTGAHGRLLAEKNEELVALYEGPLGYPGTVNYFKFGLYDYTKTQKNEITVNYGTFERF